MLRHEIAQRAAQVNRFRVKPGEADTGGSLLHPRIDSKRSSTTSLIRRHNCGSAKTVTDYSYALGRRVRFSVNKNSSALTAYSKPFGYYSG